MEAAVVWIADSIAKDLGLAGTEYPCKIMEIKQMVYEVLKEGRPRDIVILPFFRNYGEVIQHIRDRGILGPVIIYSQNETLFMNLGDMASQGVIFLDAIRFNKTMMQGFITFLQKSQDVGSTCSENDDVDRTYRQPTNNVEEIRELFRLIMRRRARIIITCQFREDLPTLTVSTEVIQMVGEVETRLVLDKFNPVEFVGLYKQLGKGKVLSGFVSMDEETLGFTLEVMHTVMGKITALLPAAVYEQRRKFFRVEPDAKDPVTIHILPECGPTKSFAVRDVCEGGIGLSTPFPGLIKDATYPVALALPNTRLILGSAKVASKEQVKADQFIYGMALSLNESDMINLRHYVYKRQSGILASIRNLSL